MDNNNQSVEDLKEENKRLFKELSFAQKNIEFLGTFRNILNNFCSKCVCEQNIENKITFTYLENNYKTFLAKIMMKNDGIDDSLVDLSDSEDSDDMSVAYNQNNLQFNNQNNINQQLNLVENRIQSDTTGQLSIEYRPESASSSAMIPNRKSFGCSQPGCEASFTSSQMLNIHEKSHSLNNSLIMDLNKPPVSTKVKTNSGIIYKCDFDGCLYETRKSYNLSVHKKRHIGVRSYVCDWPGCDRTFVTIQERIKHKIIHSDERPFTCDWPGCESKFKEKKSLTKHYRIHTGEKPYLCQWPNCGKRFRVPYHLKRHELTHTGVKNYACDICGKRFTTSTDRNKHLTTHDNNRNTAHAYNRQAVVQSMQSIQSIQSIQSLQTLQQRKTFTLDDRKYLNL